MADLVWTAEAQDWLSRIHGYLRERSPAAADRTLDGILNKAELLRRFPLAGYRYEAVGDREIRILLHGHFRIVYQFAAESRVEILGVFHAAMRIEDYFA